MSRRYLRLTVILGSCLAAAPAAWAATSAPAKPVKGAQYEGVTAREGTTITAGKTVRRKSTVLLRVAKSGKAVTVLVAVLPSTCTETGQGAVEKTSPVRISSRGAFHGTITYKGIFDPGVTAKASFKGHFNWRRASGSLNAEFLKVKGCNTATTFTATAPAPKKKK